jgi:hypothetical protein
MGICIGYSTISIPRPFEVDQTCTYFEMIPMKIVDYLELPTQSLLPQDDDDDNNDDAQV